MTLPSHLTDNFESLISLTSATLDAPADAIKFTSMMRQLSADVYDDNDTLLLGLIRAPAAKGNHHDREGGLVEHLLEMWSVYSILRTAYPQLDQPPHITPARVLTAIICHDLHKGYRTFKLIAPEGKPTWERGDPWKADYAQDPSDQLTTSDVKTMALLARHGIALDDEQLNALCWAEGGWSKIQPKWTSVLAKLCYMLDEMSGNVLERINKQTLLDHRKPLSH